VTPEEADKAAELHSDTRSPAATLGQAATISANRSLIWSGGCARCALDTTSCSQCHSGSELRLRVCNDLLVDHPLYFCISLSAAAPPAPNKIMRNVITHCASAPKVAAASHAVQGFRKRTASG
jgi:hypothetical protein